jgi:hypothetical protein
VHVQVNEAGASHAPVLNCSTGFSPRRRRSIHKPLTQTERRCPPR